MWTLYTGNGSWREKGLYHLSSLSHTGKNVNSGWCCGFNYYGYVFIILWVYWKETLRVNCTLLQNDGFFLIVGFGLRSKEYIRDRTFIHFTKSVFSNAKSDHHFLVRTGGCCRKSSCSCSCSSSCSSYSCSCSWSCSSCSCSCSCSSCSFLFLFFSFFFFFFFFFFFALCKLHQTVNLTLTNLVHDMWPYAWFWWPYL